LNIQKWLGIDKYCRQTVANENQKLGDWLTK